MTRLVPICDEFPPASAQFGMPPLQLLACLASFASESPMMVPPRRHLTGAEEPRGIIPAAVAAVAA
eukprot:CAMPEP_0172907430 /NCGR_PEP_ID=MMETSP1075-20121228/178814_1 /TAXON_ID=2916 /ORGANISM="Ceratium fusus, Strain PA161109" /LENGTH=65 /DNA_ID=CAMNT_0013765045 /DNA_START=400 /DNA_END=595 /DNA_ORIENTATION=-